MNAAARRPAVADEHWTPRPLTDEQWMRHGLVVLRYRAMRRRALRRARGRTAS